MVPVPFKPKLHAGNAIAGICLIRLEEMRPAGLPRILGFSSENAAHHFAVEWVDPNGSLRQGVDIPRRDSNFWLNRLAGGRLFPGEHSSATFQVTDDATSVSLDASSLDGSMSLHLKGAETDAFPIESCFESLDESSAFFAGGSLGYSATRGCDKFDGIELETCQWRVRPFDVEEVRSSFFSDEALFPPGSAVFDHALIMRDIAHRWVAQPSLSA